MQLLQIIFLVLCSSFLLLHLLPLWVISWETSLWNSCLQGRRVSSSSCSNFFRQIGHSESESSLSTLVGKLSMKSLDVGGGGLSANKEANSSWFQLPDVTRNLANCRSSSGAAPSARGVQSCSSKYELIF